MTEPILPNDNTLAYAGISLFGNRSQGAAPEWHELSLWHSGDLSPERSAEILSHVANNPDYFQLWLDLVDAEHWIAEEDLSLLSSPDTDEQHDTLSQPIETLRNKKPDYASDKDWGYTVSNWFRALFQQPVYGGAFAAVLLAVLIVPLMRQAQQDSLQQRLDRSMDTYIQTSAPFPDRTPVKSNTRSVGTLFDELSVSDVERHYFQYGIHLAAMAMTELNAPNWQDWLSELPTAPPDCSKALDTPHCTDIAEEFEVLGQWSLLTYASCVVSGSVADIADNSDFWQQHSALYERLSAKPALQESVLFATEFATPASTSVSGLCNRADQLLAQGQ